jgi:hypothetical protein
MQGDDVFGPFVTRYMRDLHVRDFDFQGIAARARALDSVREPLSKRLTYALAALAVAVPTMALGFSNRAALEAQITAQLSAWNKSSIRTTFVHARQTVTLATAKERADFHFVLPTGLPKDAHFERIEEIDPSTYAVTYRRAHAGSLYFSIWKRDPVAHVRPMAAFFVTDGDKILRSYRMRTYVWNVGDESVILPSASGLASKDVAAMDRAMAR